MPHPQQSDCESNEGVVSGAGGGRVSGGRFNFRLRGLLGIFPLTIAVFLALVIWEAHSLKSYFELQRDLEPTPRQSYVPVPNDTDRAQWACLAEKARSEGVWFCKWNADDNYPWGAEVHWSSSIVWLALLTSKVWGWWHGIPESAHTVYWGAALVSPLVTIVGGTLLFLATSFAVGRWAAGVVVLVFAFAPGAESYVHPSALDHHGLILLCLYFFVVSTYALFSKRERGREIVWVGVSAFSAAVGLWVGALSMFPALVAVAVGCTLAAFYAGREPRGEARKTGVFWIFAFFTIAAGLYMLEYSHAGWSFRLEANNPITIASVIGLAMIVLWAWRKSSGGGDALLFLGIGMASLVPFVVVVGGDLFYSPKDPEFGRFLQFIAECQPTSAGVLSRDVLLWTAACVAGVAMSTRMKEQPETLTVVVPLAIFTPLALLHARWVPFFLALCAVLIGLAVQQGAGKRDIWRVSGVLVLAWVLTGMVQVFSYRTGGMPKVDTREFERTIEVRDVCRAIELDLEKRTAMGTNKPVVLAAPVDSNYIAYYLGAKTIGRASWEGFPGFRRWAVAMCTKTDDALKEVCDEAGVDYVVVNPKMDSMLFMLYGRRALTIRKPYLFDALLAGHAPEWLENVSVEPQAGTLKLYRVKRR